jgi:hypothetical protein
MKNTALRILAILLFSVGVLLGLALLFTATWADVESVFYGFDRYGNKTASSMNCPILITREESGVISASFKNTTNQSIRPTVRFQASNTSVFRTETTRLSLEPGQSETLRWEVTKSDVALDHFIFAKIFTFASYPQKDVEQTCGMLVLDLPGFTGKQLTIFTILGSLVGMAGGCGMWSLAHKPLKFRSLDAFRAMITLTATVVAGIISTLLGWWPLGILLSALSLILTGVIVGHFFQSDKA